MNKAKVTFLRARVCNVDMPSGFITSAMGGKTSKNTVINRLQNTEIFHQDGTALSEVPLS